MADQIPDTKKNSTTGDIDPEEANNDELIHEEECDSENDSSSADSEDESDDSDDDIPASSSDVFIEIRLAGRTHELPGLYDCQPGANGVKRAKLGDNVDSSKFLFGANSVIAAEKSDAFADQKKVSVEKIRPYLDGQTTVRHCYSSDLPTSDPFLSRSQASNVFEDVFVNKSDQIHELWSETQAFLESPGVSLTGQRLASSLPPAQLESGWNGSPYKRKRKAATTRAEEKYPRPWRPVARPPARLLSFSDQASHIVPSMASMSSIMTLNEALEASDKARIIVLSFAPFIIVHVNMAFTQLTGFSSGDVLGEGLYQCLLDGQREYKTTPTAMVADLHDQLTQVLSKQPQTQIHCHLRVAPLGPETNFVDGAEDEENEDGDNNLCVTHYIIELESVDNAGASLNGLLVSRLSTVSPDMSPCGILG